MKFTFSILLIFVMTTQLFAQDSCNCCTADHQAFDFWIGSWTVTNPSGELEGYSTIDKPNGNCLMRETYTNAQGEYVGTSNNFFHEQGQKWEQIWIYADGRTLYLTGNKVGNQMILKSPEKKNAAGVIEQDIITWTDNADGTVRQYWIHTFDGENTQVRFDGIYKKKK
jgi:hypothetical protein